MMKTDKELIDKANAIIDSLSDCSVAEKYRVISSLHESLKDTMESEGMEIIQGKSSLLEHNDNRGEK
ncbi:hypothetical protein GOV13_02685 [Candidatus Pacearchaeota archaeon]|nr:hypothetical protein [Candidatus Pacearchaeota archaeon]